MNAIKTIIFGMILMATAAANAECKIVLQHGCKPAKMRQGAVFTDGDAAANLDPNRCLQRAREYMNYCAVYQQVGSEFYVNGVLTISSYVTPTTAALFTKSASGLWIQVKKDY